MTTRAPFQLFLIYANQAWHRRWAALACIWLVTASGWTVIMLLPNLYTSEARIFVDTRDSLRPLLRGLAVDADTSSELILLQQTFTSPTNLGKIVETHALTERLGSYLGPAPLTGPAVIEWLQASTSISRDGSNLYKLAFTASDPELAQEIANTLVESFVGGNVDQTQLDISAAQRFIDEQIEKYALDLTRAEDRLASFRRLNRGLLPGQNGFFAKLAELEDKLATAERDFKDTRIAADLLRERLSNIPETQNLGPIDASGPPTDTEYRIFEVESRLAELLTRYTGRHPDVISAQKALNRLREREASELGTFSPNGGDAGTSFMIPNPLYESLQLSLAEKESENSILVDRISELRQQLVEISSFADDVPLVEAQLTRLNRDYEVLKSKHDALLSRREEARISQQRENIGADRFRIVDPPSIPLRPSGPDARILQSLSLLIGIGSGLFLGVTLGQTGGTFTTTTMLSSAFDTPVIGRVPVLGGMGNSLLGVTSSGLFLGGCIVLIVFYAALMIGSSMPVGGSNTLADLIGPYQSILEIVLATLPEV